MVATDLDATEYDTEDAFAEAIIETLNDESFEKAVEDDLDVEVSSRITNRYP